MPAVRLVPVVLFAMASLFVLKTAALLQSGGYTIGGLSGARAQEAGKRSWAQDVLGYPDITGSVGGKSAPKASADEAKTADPPPPPARGELPAPDRRGKPGTVVLDGKGPQTPGEQAVLESLQERREQLEARTRELDMREGLVKAAEKRLEVRLQELKATEAQIKAASDQKDDAEAARLKSVVTMYEAMKAKDAARIFDRLELKILLTVASAINPRRMSEILAQMSPEAAERLTVELASRARMGEGDARDGAVNPLDLPKIEGKPRS